MSILARNFRLPSLTLQPMVENAVKHGIGKREEGGTVTITTVETMDCYKIIVSDNGVGFLPNRKNTNTKEHIGIENVRQRLYAQCGGTLDIASKPGLGSEIILSIPK